MPALSSITNFYLFPNVCMSGRVSHVLLSLTLYLRLLAMRLFMKAKKLTGLALIPML